MRRRLYLMRHGAVSYFDAVGRPVRPDGVTLTEQGRVQAAAAAALLEPVVFDRVIASDLPRAVETARIVARGAPVEEWPELQEIRTGRLFDVPDEEHETAFVRTFRGVLPPGRRFLGGETFGSLFDRVVPALERLLEDEAWDTALVVAHGGVNRAVLSWALTGERMLLGRFEQSPGCLNVLDVDASGDEWIVRAVNTAPTDLLHASRLTTMEQLWADYRRGPGSAGA